MRSGTDVRRGGLRCSQCFIPISGVEIRALCRTVLLLKLIKGSLIFLAPMKRNCNATAYKEILYNCALVAVWEEPTIGVMVRCLYKFCHIVQVVSGNLANYLFGRRNKNRHQCISLETLLYLPYGCISQNKQKKMPVNLTI